MQSDYEIESELTFHKGFFYRSLLGTMGASPLLR